MPVLRVQRIPVNAEEGRRLRRLRTLLASAWIRNGRRCYVSLHSLKIMVFLMSSFRDPKMIRTSVMQRPSVLHFIHVEFFRSSSLGVNGRWIESEN